MNSIMQLIYLIPEAAVSVKRSRLYLHVVHANHADLPQTA